MCMVCIISFPANIPTGSAAGQVATDDVVAFVETREGLQNEDSHGGGMFSNLVVLRCAGAERRSAGAHWPLERLYRRPRHHSADGLEFLERLRRHSRRRK